MKKDKKEKIKLNRWQKIFMDHYYNGKEPSDKRGKKQMELLAGINNAVTIHFPEMDGVNGVKPAHDVTYVVTEDRCDMPNGIISAVVLSWQILTWDRCGYRIKSDTEPVEKTA